MRLPEGLYDLLLDEALAAEVASLDGSLFEVLQQRLDPGDSHVFLARHLYGLLLRKLQVLPSQERLARQVELCNLIILLLDDEEHGAPHLPDAESLRRLLAIMQRPLPDVPVTPRLPDTPLSLGCLLTGTRQDPSLVSQLRSEILSADRVDILCSFIRWTGVRTIAGELQEFTSRGSTRLRVITTSYMGATDARAVEFLSALPDTEVKVSYDTKHTRLHAKAYLFGRETGFGTAYVGSANLSRAALTEGLEWTIKISQAEQAYLWEKTAATFETYWHDPQFELYNALEKERLRGALRAERSGHAQTGPGAFFNLAPYPYQQEILERLAAERESHDRHRHLVVAATGTGKTVLAAFDFRNWREHSRRDTPVPRARLLYVAHREEILRQSLATFRGVLRDANFGELMVGGREPESRDHLFVSIQTFNTQDMPSQIPADYYDYVVIDEFHHAAAPSYRRLLSSICPRVLLGLTATPERADSLDVLCHFGHHISAELRLPDAVNRALLSPFQYFCVSDIVDLDGLRWQRGGYSTVDLDGLYTGNDARAALVINKVHQYLLDPIAARGLAFCVSVAHAEYMAQKFNEAGLPAAFLCGDSPDDVRNDVQRRLRDREINFIFVVDLYNEGVDIPEVDTVLFLRPTESLTVFLQQLGRGLRISEGKECLTVLDFVGQAHRNYRFDLKFRALLSTGHHSIEQEVEHGFPHLPAGCTLQMERVAAQHVMENIKRAVSIGSRLQLAQRIRVFEDETGKALSLGTFLSHHGMDLDDMLRRGSWSRLCALAGVREDFTDPDEPQLQKGLRRLAHIDDADWIATLKTILRAAPADLAQRLRSDEVARRVLMLHFSLWGRGQQMSGLQESVERLHANPVMLADLLELLEIRYEALPTVTHAAELPFPCPLRLHATYTRDELLAALGHWTWASQPYMREGVLHLAELPADLFLITLNKTETDYSPTTMYEDYAISERLFHWQSQSTTSAESPTGQRYVHHREFGHTILMAVREDRSNRGLSCPFHFLGAVDYVAHRGSRPVSITWRLRHPLPAHLLKVTERLAVG